LKKNTEITPKLIIFAALLSMISIVCLFFIPKPKMTRQFHRPQSNEKLFAQVIQASLPKIRKLWQDGDHFIKKEGLKCDDEIIFDKKVGRSYFQCQPHFWQCYWSGGVQSSQAIEVEMFGQVYHVRAKNNFSPIPEYSAQNRFYEILKGPYQDMNFHYGVLVELALDEVPDMTWPLILTDTCRDVYLPQRIYGYGKINQEKNDQGFIWDNFDRHIFIDKFYVSNQMVNEWRILSGEASKIEMNRQKWPQPALLSLKEQHAYCSFWGKRILEAKFFDASAMTPGDLKDPMAERVQRPQTPWQRDIGKSFLGMARINPDYQLTPLDCQLAQVQGCLEKYFTTDSVTWMGMNYALGFYPESFVNHIEPSQNLKLSSRFQPAESPVHELGILTNWDGNQDSNLPVAFRCYEEVSL
jgi:hypothetical protein